MNNKFLKGMLAGIVSAVSVMLVFLLILTYFDFGGKYAKGGSAKGASGDSSSSGLLSGLNEVSAGQSGDSEQFFQAKKTYIKNLISEFYIDEATSEDYQLAELRAMLEVLGDPYSCYYTEEEFDELMESSSGIYSGIGALVSQNADTKIITIVKPFSGGPADKAGVQAGDMIYKVDGRDVSEMDLEFVVSMMKGRENTKVTIEVVRKNVSGPVKIEITRGQVEVPTVEYKMLEDNIGYIYILQFDQVTDEQFIRAVDDLLKKGMKGLVIDIRDNGGGLLDVVVSMLDRLLPEGMIVYTEDKNGEKEEFKSTAEEQVDIPMAVIVNGYSASASEIFAGALQDYDMAEIVGTQSFGKGIVQRIFSMTDGTAVKLTVSRYYTPDGRCIHGEGITPDIVAEAGQGEEDLKAGRVQTDGKAEDEIKDRQLEAAIKAVLEKME